MTQKIKAEDLLPEPRRPEDWECCGCEYGELCVQTLYQQEKAAYDAQQRAWKEQQAAEANQQANEQ